MLLGRLTLVAPVDGVIEALPYRLGERPMLGAPVVIMLASGMPYARVYIPEPQRAALRAGQSLSVHVDGVKQPFKGTLRYIAGEAEFHAVLRADAAGPEPARLSRRDRPALSLRSICRWVYQSRCG